MEKFKENQEKINRNRDEKLQKIKQKEKMNIEKINRDRDEKLGLIKEQDKLNKEKYLEVKEKNKVEIKANIEGIKKEGTKIKEEFNNLKENLTELKKEYQSNRSSNCCPRCNGNNIVSNKRGIGVGKAVAGGVLLGPIGLLAGAIGKNKIQLTCLDCRKQFKL